MSTSINYFLLLCKFGLMKGIVTILLFGFVLLLSCTSGKPAAKIAAADTLNEIQRTIVFSSGKRSCDTADVGNQFSDTIPRVPPVGGTTTPSFKSMKHFSTSSVRQIDIMYPEALLFPQTAGGYAAVSENGTKERYRIAYLLPFFADKFSDKADDFYEKSNWALQFYAGAKLALDSLQKDNIRLEVEVQDTRASETHLNKVLQMEAVRNADVIIGTETGSNVEIAADFVKKNNKILISPYNPSSDFVINNPNFVQISPSLRTNCEAIMRSVKKSFSVDQIVLLCRDKNNEKEALQYLQLENRRLSGAKSKPLKECVLDEKDGLGVFDPKTILPKENMVIVVPVWGQNSETFIYSLLSKINAVKGKKNITVFGMPQWSNFQVNVYDVFEPLQVHITQSAFVDTFSPNVVAFSALFYNTYHTVPSDEAYAGFDITMYCGHMLQKFGAHFNQVMDKIPYKGMHTHFNFEKEGGAERKPADSNQSFDRIVNKFVNILKFQNGCFEPEEQE
jgi:hypothetical protein